MPGTMHENESAIVTPNDEPKGPRMTAKVISDICRKHGGYRTASLNDKLYLHRQGYSRVENLEPYTGLKVLWLEGNALSTLEGTLDAQADLRALHVNQNLLERIDGISHMKSLDTLNVSNNFIDAFPDFIADMPSLKTVQIASNQLASWQALEPMTKSKTVSIIDLSSNKIDDPDTIIRIAETMSGNLKVLNVSGNPAVAKMKDYRKRMICACKSLTYLDDAPVFEDERRIAEAWGEGGRDKEREMRREIRREKEAKDRANFEKMKELMEGGENHRRELEQQLKDINSNNDDDNDDDDINDDPSKDADDEDVPPLEDASEELARLGISAETAVVSPADIHAATSAAGADSNVNVVVDNDDDKEIEEKADNIPDANANIDFDDLD